MLIKYVGRRTVYQVRFGRVPYDFTEENDYTLEIKEKEVINYIFGLPNKGEFEVTEREVKKEIKEEVKKPVEKVEKTKKSGGKNGKRKSNK